jgi:hypothetical protein
MHANSFGLLVQVRPSEIIAGASPRSHPENSRRFLRVTLVWVSRNAAATRAFLGDRLVPALRRIFRK